MLATAGFLIFTGTTIVTSTTCKVIHTDFDHSNMTCRCGIQCTAQYPCLRVYVKYTLHETEVQGMLHETDVKDKVSDDLTCCFIMVIVFPITKVV